MPRECWVPMTADNQASLVRLTTRDQPRISRPNRWSFGPHPATCETRDSLPLGGAFVALDAGIDPDVDLFRLQRPDQ